MTHIPCSNRSLEAHRYALKKMFRHATAFCLLAPEAGGSCIIPIAETSNTPARPKEHRASDGCSFPSMPGARILEFLQSAS
jgi:hypothetical protein